MDRTETPAPYAMPDPGALPADRSGWVIEPARAALLVLNPQNHFLRVLRERSAPVSQLVSGIALLCGSARAAGIPVLYTLAGADGRAAGRGTAFGHPALLRDGDAREVAEEIRPQVGDGLLTAKRFSAFAGTRLRQRLAELGRDQPVITGVFARTQKLLTAADVAMQDMEPFVVADAVADRAPDQHRMAVEWIAATWGAVRSVTGVADVFGGPPAP
ncbi:isochorismatase family protein [Streptomyces bauhiniae]|uniref:Isochorismatase family protein n=1 Tax=Streptomyces bauhiniae TaxID=2340725 RepID=A0A7K3QX13_9ACTN|nr:isochorismatase family protein [Streptomyces bauhiniae]NEB94399.1 isochorismatase family protein [Streptomyces bauhiniae]